MIKAEQVDFEKQNDHFGNVLIIGLGMIGGSFAKALKSRGLAYLYGADRRDDELKLGVATNVIDSSVELTKDSIQSMDIILLATPVRAMEAVLLELKPLLSSHTLVTDVGSTKGSVIEAAKSVFGEVPVNFIPGHPIAGAEKSGVLAANENLFEEHKVILTPQSNSDPMMLDTLHRLWSAIGAEVLSMDVAHHDAVLANSSHLPHLLAYTLVDALANGDRSQDVFKFAAGGFRDFTRIASSDPTMWRDVFLANKEATLESLDNFTAHLEQIRSFIEKADGSAMFGVFTRAKSARDHFLRLQKSNNSSIAPIKTVSVKVLPASLIKGEPNLIGDKVLSQAALVISAVAQGVSDLQNLDQSESTKITLQALRDMGVVIENLSQNHIRIHGVGLQGLKAPIAPINIYDSELSLHALLPVLIRQGFNVALTAEGDLLRKPFTKLARLMLSMGGELLTTGADCLPFKVGVPSDDTECYQSDVNIDSEQMELAVLMAYIMVPSDAKVNFDARVGGKTKYLLSSFGSSVQKNSKGIISVGASQLKAVTIQLPSDTIKTAWMMLLGSLLPGTQLTLNNAFIDREEEAFFNVMCTAGADISVTADNGFGVMLNVGFSSLKGFEISRKALHVVESELLFLCVAAVYAEGKTRIRGIDSLSYHCQDRLSVFIDALVSLNVPVKLNGNILEIDGFVPNGGELDCAGDYLLALAMLALGARSRHPIVVNDCQKLFKEFEEFEAVVEHVGFHCQIASK